MSNNKQDAKKIGLLLTPAAVPPGAARMGKVSHPQEITLRAGNLETQTTPESSHINTEKKNDTLATETPASPHVSTPAVAQFNSTQISARKAKPRISLSGSRTPPTTEQPTIPSSKVAEETQHNTAEETALSLITEKKSSPKTAISADAETVPQVKASTARPKLSLKGVKTATTTNTVAADISIANTAKKTLSEAVAPETATEDTHEPPKSENNVPTVEDNITTAELNQSQKAASSVDNAVIQEETTEEIDTTTLGSNIEKSADITHITQYTQRHGSPAWAVLQPIGRAGVRITLIAKDGILGDQVVQNLAQAHDIISRLEHIEISDWTRELNSKTTISPKHWLKMAGWVAKSHHFPKFKSRSA